MSLRIAKTLCTVKENQWQRVLEVQGLPGTQLAGYKLLVPLYLTRDAVKFVVINEPRNQDFRFEAIKIDREPGKRYARLKLTYEEVRTVYSEHSEQFNFDLLPQVLVLLKDYLNNCGRRSGEVIRKRYCIGGTDGTWFYDGLERRRMGTHGVTVLKKLSQEEVPLMQAKLERLQELSEKVAAFKHCFIDYAHSYFFEKMQKMLSSNNFKKAHQLLDKINDIVATEAAASQAEFEELEQYFNSFKGETE